MAIKPRIVLLDVETSPIVGYTWTTYDANVLKIIEPTKIISVAWKELHDDGVTVRCLADYKGYKKGILDDKPLIKEIWDVLDKADVLIAHNGNSFDFKKLNSRFVVHGLSSPSLYQTIDTLALAKKYFRFDSNSLDNLGSTLGLGQKIVNGGFSLWTRCMAGDPDAWKLMKEYNAQDVVLLEKVYLTLRPFERRHPDLNLLSGNKEDISCGTCLSKNVQKRGFSLTKTGRKQRHQCSDCGSWSLGSFERTRVSVEAEAEDA